MTTARKYIFAGGGTGGHLFPGIAVAHELRQREPNCQLLFVGSERDLEQSILARHQLDHQTLPVESLQTLKRRPLRFLIRNWQAWQAARRLIRRIHPAVVIGLGGYASAPVVWAAARAGIPVVLLEQNVIPGRTTRWLARSAALVCVSFAEAASRLPAGIGIEVTGNPLRREIAELHGQPRADDSPKELLILGGSQGADSLNDAVAIAIQQLKNEFSEWRLVHQAGPRQVASLRATYSSLSIAATVEPFFDDMRQRYQSASLVISRAGATTLAELTCCGLPMVLLPYPHAADDHQRANAQSLKVRGAAVVVEHQSSSEETGRELAAQLQPLLRNRDLCKAMSDAAVRLAHPDAAEAVAERTRSLGKH